MTKIPSSTTVSMIKIGLQWLRPSVLLFSFLAFVGVPRHLHMPAAWAERWHAVVTNLLFILAQTVHLGKAVARMRFFPVRIVAKAIRFYNLHRELEHTVAQVNHYSAPTAKTSKIQERTRARCDHLLDGRLAIKYYGNQYGQMSRCQVCERKWKFDPVANEWDNYQTKAEIAAAAKGRTNLRSVSSLPPPPPSSAATAVAPAPKASTSSSSNSRSKAAPSIPVPKIPQPSTPPPRPMTMAEIATPSSWQDVGEYESEVEEQMSVTEEGQQ